MFNCEASITKEAKNIGNYRITAKSVLMFSFRKSPFYLVQTLSAAKSQNNLSYHMGKPTICIDENKGADQLRSNCEADQRLCFRYTDRTIPLLSKSKMSSLYPSSVTVQSGLYRTWSEPKLLVFSHIGSFQTDWYIPEPEQITIVVG